MTFGTISFGFFRDTARFRQKLMYWHIIPTSTELGYQCPGKDLAVTMDSYAEGIRIQDQFVLAAAAGEIAKSKSGVNGASSGIAANAAG